MDRNIGFRRNITLPWLDATASACLETGDRNTIRARLNEIVGQSINSSANRRMAVDILVNIWVKNGDLHPSLHEEALELFASAATASDRIWLHYGLTMLYYDFFRRGVAAIGQISRYSDEISTSELKKRLKAELGEIGALDNATERIIFSLRNWGILVDSSRRYTYSTLRNKVVTSRPEYEIWLLSATLTARPMQEIPVPDLLRLPELFPFHFCIGVDDLRRSPRFEIHRQGLGWDMAGLANQGADRI